MPRKEFESFTRLDASDVNTFLMDQSVMTFAGTAARGSAITTPVEGMVTWLNDENALQVYDGSQWNGLAASGGNAIINGAFDIWQRGTSGTALGTFVADRWIFSAETGTTMTVSQQTFTPGDEPVVGGSQFFLRAAISNNTGRAAFAGMHKIEDVRTFAGQTVTLSYYAKANTAVTGRLLIGQDFGSGGSATNVFINDEYHSITTSWQRFTATFTVPSISGKTIGAGSNLLLQVGRIVNANATIDIWGVQLEAGPTANVFRRNANSLEGELAACQRYYYRAINEGTSEASFATAMAVTTTRADSVVPFPVTMRVAPTVLDTANLRFGNFAYSTANLSSLTIPLSSRNSATVSGVASGLSAGQVGFLLSVPSTAAFIGFSAEL